MVERTARQGPNAGGKFYGCSRYPTCKSTTPFDGATTKTPPHAPPEPEPAFPNADLTTFPKRMAATSSSPGTQAFYFQTVALPRDAVAAIANDGDERTILALAQWQLDLVPSADLVAEPQPVWLPVTEKILKRGRTVPLSPTLEKEIRELAGEGAPHDDWLNLISECAQARRPFPLWSGGFDSEEERWFVERILTRQGFEHAAGWLLRQVPLDAFSPTLTPIITNRRIDFVLAHPSGLQLAIEIDGEHHRDQSDADDERDAILLAAGFETLRIPTDEVQRGDGEKLRYLSSKLSTIPDTVATPTRAAAVILSKRAHQLQVSLTHAIAMGALQGHTIRVAVDLGGTWPLAFADRFVRSVLDDLNCLTADIADLYGVPRTRFEYDPAADFKVAFDGAASTNSRKAIIRDVYLPFALCNEVTSHAPPKELHVERNLAERLLRRIFGFFTFREGQFEALSRSLKGHDSIVLLPTGAGKSITFQLSSLLRPGVCLVVDPILGLIDDQIENLQTVGISRTSQISSALSESGRKAVLELLARGEYLFCYVAPERFQDKAFRESLRVLTSHTAVSLIAIDEAHCVSEWGHDFRPAYLNLARISREYCATDAVPPPLMALTGTASRAVLKDIQRELQILDFEALITPRTFDRPELRLRAIPCRSDEKSQRLRGLVESLPRQFGSTASAFFETRGTRTHAGLVFCLHVNGGFGVVQVADELSKALGRRIPFYAGKSPKGYDEKMWPALKRETATSFKRNRVALMACTNAFGMGIDKPNVRYTVHYGLPPSIESFYQEAGRAGRDGAMAQCCVFYSNDDPQRTKHLLTPSLSIDGLREEMEAVTWSTADDITRALFFHKESFVGVEAELSEVRSAIDDIGDLDTRRVVAVAFGGDTKGARERAIHRLLTIGVVADYTIDYSSRQFTIQLSGASSEDIAEFLYRYVAAYQRGQAKVVAARINQVARIPHVVFVTAVVRELIQFVYEVIERSRRQALSEMLFLCEQCRDEISMRKRLLAYLGTSAFSEAIEGILEAPDGGLHAAVRALEAIASPLDVGHVRGECGRALEAYPDHPGLRLLRSSSEAMANDTQAEVVRQNMEACVSFAEAKYAVPFDTMIQAVLSALHLVGDMKPAASVPMLRGLIEGSSDKRLVARTVIGALPRSMSEPAVTFLLHNVKNRLFELLQR